MTRIAKTGNSYYVENSNPHGLSPIDTCDTQGIRKHAGEQFAMSDDTRATYAMKISPCSDTRDAKTYPRETAMTNEVPP